MPLYRNYAGQLTEAPVDFPTIVAQAGDVIWSKAPKNQRRNKRHQVRYGLQKRQFRNSADAAEEFGFCVHHQAECSGLLD